MKYYLKEKDCERWVALDLTRFEDKLPEGAVEAGEVVFTISEGKIVVWFHPGYEFLGIQRQVVESTNIKSVGYFSVGRILVVEFTTGAIYQYSDVPEAVFVDMMNSKSKGKYFSAEIKGKYSSVKVEG